MSPLEDWRSFVRSATSSGQSRRRWCEVFRSRPHGHGSAGILGGESVGGLLQNTLHIARVSAQSTPCRWSGNLNEGLESRSSCFHRLRNDIRAWAKSQALVVSANRQGIVEDAPALARVSALSLPRIPQWEGHQTVETCQPIHICLFVDTETLEVVNDFEGAPRIFMVGFVELEGVGSSLVVDTDID